MKQKLHITMTLREDKLFDIELAHILGKEVLTHQAVRMFAKTGDTLIVTADVATDGTVAGKAIKPVRRIKDYVGFDDPLHGPKVTIAQ